MVCSLFGKPNDGITVPIVAATNSGVYALKADEQFGRGYTYDGSTSSTVSRTSPVQVVKTVNKDTKTYLENIKHIAAGPTHMLAVDTDGHVWALGNNANGKLGIGGTSTAYTPTLVKNKLNRNTFRCRKSCSRCKKLSSFGTRRCCICMG